MGAATAALAGELGAEVTVLDLRPPAGEGRRFIQTDLGDAAAIDAALARIGGPIDALLNCQGISGAALTSTGRRPRPHAAVRPRQA